MLKSFRKIFVSCAFAAVVALAGACSDSPSEPTSPIGEYNLYRVNDVVVPAPIFVDEGYRYEWFSGTLEVEADMSFVIALIRLETVDGNPSEYVDSLRGSWTLDNMGALQFNVVGEGVNPVMPGSWEGRRVTVLFTEDVTSSSLLFQRR
jgi:hypothetical protein